MKVILLTMALTLLGGCVQPYPVYDSDPKARQARFDVCMATLPVGPRSTVYNDWAEVVEMCDDIARRQTQRCVANCPSYESGANDDTAAERGTEPRGDGPRMDGGRDTTEAAAPAASLPEIER